MISSWYYTIGLVIIVLHGTDELCGQILGVPEWSLSQDSGIVSIISGVKESTVTAYIGGLQGFGTRYWNNPNRDSVFTWVQNSFLEMGITDVFVDNFEYSGTRQENIIATIEGVVNPGVEMIVGGHLDSYSSDLLRAPGADDNASGTAAVLMMARALRQANYQPSLTLRFIGFAAEEAGLKGSLDYAQKAQHQHRDIKIMFNYDMIGYRDQSSSDRDCNVVWYPGSEAYSNLYTTVVREYTPLTPILTTQFRSSSDSWSFYQHGYNTLFVIERDFNPYYHQPSDSLSKLDIPYACEIIKSGLATLLTLDQVPTTPTGLIAQGVSNSIILLWQKNRDMDLRGYNIYRRSISETDFLRLNSQLYTDTVCIDSLFVAETYIYRVSAVDLLGLESPLSDSVQASPVVGVEVTASYPMGFKLEQNYPNPFNPVTVIRYRMPVSGRISLKVYDLLGHEVVTLVNETQEAGYKSVQWDANGLPSGVYFYRLTAKNFSVGRSMVLIK